MTFAALALALMMQQATAPADLPPAPPPATEEADETEFKRIFVKDADEATRVEVQDPMQQICVRRLVLGSRVKARTMCQDQTSWKAYVLAREADVDKWANVAKGVPVE